MTCRPPIANSWSASKTGEPDWDLIGLPGIADLPAVRWKQRKLDQLAPDRRDRVVEGLRAVWPS